MNRKKIMFLMVSCLLLFSGCEGNGAETTEYSETENAGIWRPERETAATQLPVQTGQKLTETDLMVRKTLVQIQAGDLQGSGVIYDEDEKSILIVTAGHVLTHDNGEILVSFPEGTQVAASGSEMADSCDLAFLWVDKTELPLETWEACLPVPTDRNVFDAMKAYDDVWMYGGETGMPVYAFVVEPWIYVEDFEQYMLLLQGIAEPGMSGGGVFTEDGVFLGIICGADEEGKVAVVPYSMVETEKPEQN
mgnify:CR=1 FL=1